MKLEPQSVCMNLGRPNIVQKFRRAGMLVLDFSVHLGIASGNWVVVHK